MLCLVWFITIILDIIHKNHTWRIIWFDYKYNWIVYRDKSANNTLIYRVRWNESDPYFDYFCPFPRLASPGLFWLTDGLSHALFSLVKSHLNTGLWLVLAASRRLSPEIIDLKHKQRVILSVLFPPDNWCLKISWAEIIPRDWWWVCLQIEACSPWSHL